MFHLPPAAVKAPVFCIRGLLKTNPAVMVVQLPAVCNRHPCPEAQQRWYTRIHLLPSVAVLRRRAAQALLQLPCPAEVVSRFHLLPAVAVLRPQAARALHQHILPAPLLQLPLAKAWASARIFREHLAAVGPSRPRLAQHDSPQRPLGAKRVPTPLPLNAPALLHETAPLQWRLLLKLRPSPLPKNQGRGRPHCLQKAAAPTLAKALLQLSSQRAHQQQHHVQERPPSARQLQALLLQQRLLGQRPSQHLMQCFRPSAPSCCALLSAAVPRATPRLHPASTAFHGRRCKGSSL